MADNQAVLKVNLLGRLLGKSNVYLRNSSLFTSSLGSDTHLGSLLAGDHFASYHKGLSGGEVHLHLGQKPLVFKHIEVESAEPFVTEVNRKLSERIAVNVDRSFNEFFQLAIKEYPKDSNIAYLTELCQRLAQAYDSQPELWESYVDNVTLKKVRFLTQFHPVQSEKLREYYEQRQLNHRSEFFEKLESGQLTDEQKLAILRNNDRNLISAAAGTGKTLVMLAKVLDLLDRSLAKPEQILVLTHNEVSGRWLDAQLTIKAKQAEVALRSRPQITTFNQLGLNILEQVGQKTTLSPLAYDHDKLTAWILDWISAYIAADRYRIFEFLELTTPRLDPFSFKSQADHERYLRDNDFLTLKGEKVSSYQEMQIANFFYVNNISYVYEPDYISQRRFESAKNYKPSFLIAGDIYLDYFCLDRHGNTRAGVNTYKYSEAIRHKRNLHTECDTKYIETYYYEWVEDTLLDNLKQKLAEYEVTGEPMSPAQIYERLKEQHQPIVWAEVLINALKALRSEQLTHQMIFSRLYGAKLHQAAKHAKLLDALHQAYLAELQQQEMTDHVEIRLQINELIEQEKYHPQWKYIFVDEFQDLSTTQQTLLMNLVNKNPDTVLTLLGDDWQSTDRFSGAKPEYMTHLHDLVGSHTESKLNKTFRYNNGIANVAGQFIMENPEQQRKHILVQDQSHHSEVYLLDEHSDVEGGSEKRVAEIIAQIGRRDPKAKIAVIGHEHSLLKRLKASVPTMSDHARIQFVHYRQAKYLEVDYSILVGLRQGKNGFPSHDRTNALAEALLPLSDSYLYAEERRQLYVGLTRAKKQVYILADPNAPSEFVIDLLKPKYELNILSKTFDARHRQTFKCPCCSDGYFKRVRYSKGNGYVCSSGLGCSVEVATACEKCDSPMVDLRSELKCNSPTCDHSVKLCSRCGRSMQKQEGNEGAFWRCSGAHLGHDACTHTEAITYRVSA